MRMRNAFNSKHVGKYTISEDSGTVLTSLYPTLQAPQFKLHFQMRPHIATFKHCRNSHKVILVEIGEGFFFLFYKWNIWESWNLKGSSKMFEEVWPSNPLKHLSVNITLNGSHLVSAFSIELEEYWDSSEAHTSPNHISEKIAHKQVFSVVSE